MNISDQPQLFSMRHVFAGVQCLYQHAKVPRVPGDAINTYDGQSRKNPVSASAMLTRKFLQIRKVFATSSLLVEEFPDTLQYKISR